MVCQQVAGIFHRRILSDGHIAETFAGERFRELVENEISCGETFTDCSLVPPKDATPTNFLLQITTKPQKFAKVFSLKSFPLYSSKTRDPNLRHFLNYV